MDTPYNYYGNYGRTNWDTIMNDWYYQQVANNPYLNFKGSSNGIGQNVTQEVLTPELTENISYASNNGIPVNYATTSPDNSNTGLWVTGAIGAAAIIGGLACKGGGNPIKGAKALYEKFFKSGASKVSDKISQKLSGIQVVRNGNKVECLVPNETLKINKQSDALKHLHQYFGITSKDVFNVTKGNSTLNNGTFVFKTGDTVTFNGDKITKIIDKSGRDVTSKFLGKDVTLEGDDKTFIDNLTSFINNAKEMKQDWTKGFKTADVTRELGDNSVKITYARKTRPVIKELNTLKPVKPTDDAVKAWAYDHSEAKVLLGKDVFNNYKAPDGMKVGRAKIKSDGIVYHFNNGEIEGITRNGKYIPKGKRDCNVVLVEKEQDMKTAYEQLFNGNIEKKYRKMIDMKNVEVSYVKA